MGDLGDWSTYLCSLLCPRALRVPHFVCFFCPYNGLFWTLMSWGPIHHLTQDRVAGQGQFFESCITALGCRCHGPAPDLRDPHGGSFRVCHTLYLASLPQTDSTNTISYMWLIATILGSTGVDLHQHRKLYWTAPHTRLEKYMNQYHKEATIQKWNVENSTEQGIQFP